MAQQKLEERLAAVEKELIQLRVAIEKLTELRDWRSAVGMFSADDEAMKRIDEAGRKYREADRRRTRPKASKGRKQVQS
ncbi:MAG: hypothetical protein JNM56_23025 [Planctomycetia bacterium]|nr:hypothetical protein [Planctomycetia bacterium]